MDFVTRITSLLRGAADQGFKWSHSKVSSLSQGLSSHGSSPAKSLLTRCQDLQTNSMQSTAIWKNRFQAIVAGLVTVLWVTFIFLLGELVIWGLSRALAPLDIEFFSSILSMIVAFLVVLLASVACSSTENIYQHRIKPKIDLINNHLGVGFAVPIVMLDEAEVLGGGQIARVMGNAAVTSLLSWTFVFVASLLALKLLQRSMPCSLDSEDSYGTPGPLNCTPPRATFTVHSNDSSEEPNDRKCELESRTATPNQYFINDNNPDSEAHGPEAGRHHGYKASRGYWGRLQRVWPVILSMSGIFIAGAPVFAATGDRRVLDGFVLWFVWISAVALQRTLKTAPRWRHHRLQNMSATMMNPVLITTLLMVGYTRLMAKSILNIDVSKVTHTTLPGNPKGWYGAGDAALSLLECGIFTWGLKLFECRKQLFSVSGLMAILLSTVAAAGNVFLSVLAGRGMGLAAPEALAFSARSVTLALAKPAVEAIGGNLAVNAALVVSNGILGQLMYPFTLDRLGVQQNSTSPHSSSGQEHDGAPDNARIMRQEPFADDATTVAAGIAIGINGAAMGVAYLYDTRSRAAPYAALSMTVFGIMTVVFTTVSPFKDFLIDLAHGQRDW